MYRKKTRVMIAGERGERRGYLKECLQGREDFEIVEVSLDEKDFLEEFYRQRPDILLMDMCLSTVMSFERLASSSGITKDMRVVFLTHHSSPEVSYLLIKMGAASTIDEAQSGQEIVEILKTVSDRCGWCGKDCMSEKHPAQCYGLKVQEPEEDLFGEYAVTEPVLKEKYCIAQNCGSRFSVLSEREKEILSLIGYGYSSIEISRMLFISRRTVDVHRQHILDKLSLKNNSGLIRYAIMFNKLSEFRPGQLNECRLCCPPLPEVRKNKWKHPSGKKKI